MFLQKSQIGILGMARSGIAAALKTLDYGGNVFISEQKPYSVVSKSVIADFGESVWNRLEPHSEFGGHTERILANDYIIVSPGIPLETSIIRQALAKNIKVISEIECGYLIKKNDSKIIAVTGSNGKSTTVSIINHILKSNGYNTILAGNIGQPFTSFPIEKIGIDYIILELSSFQLELIDKFRADTSVLLNISPDHLDRYYSMKEYINAKLNIFNNHSQHNIAVLNADDPAIVETTDSLISQKVYFGDNRDKVDNLSAFIDNEKIIVRKLFKEALQIDYTQLPLLGLHNIYNTMAALLSLQNIPLDKQKVINSIETFKGLPHRLEIVAEINGIKFINDSKATNTDSVKYALSAFSNPVHIILGGYHKGEDYSVLSDHLQQYAKSIYLIGQASDDMQHHFKSLNINVVVCNDLEEAVNRAYRNAHKGEIVLLSPACASYDMFKDFEHRGNSFKDIVHNIKLSDR